MKILVSACLLGCSCRYDGKSVPHDGVCALAKTHTLVPACPEQLGGLATPRPPAECLGDRVCTQAGVDVTAQYQKGAVQALHLAQLFDCDCAILKAKSPSCGNKQIYDGTFTRNLIAGKGATATLFAAHGIAVYDETDVEGQF